MTNLMEYNSNTHREKSAVRNWHIVLMCALRCEMFFSLWGWINTLSNFMLSFATKNRISPSTLSRWIQTDICTTFSFRVYIHCDFVRIHRFIIVYPIQSTYIRSMLVIWLWHMEYLHCLWEKSRKRNWTKKTLLNLFRQL